jgi:hypothetical protein
MAKVYTGRDGYLLVGTSTIAKVVSFSVQANLETLETTALHEHLRSYTPGVTGYTGTASLLYYKEDDGSINTTSLINKLVKTGTGGVSDSDTVKLTFRWQDGDDNNDITMNAYITSASIGAATGEIVRAEIGFQGTGALSTASI